MAKWVKKLPAIQEMQETRVQSPGWEDPLEERIATHSSVLESHPRIPWTEEPGGLPSTGSQSWTWWSDSKAQQRYSLPSKEPCRCKSHPLLLCLVQRAENCLSSKGNTRTTGRIKSGEGVYWEMRFIYLLCMYLGGDALQRSVRGPVTVC